LRLLELDGVQGERLLSDTKRYLADPAHAVQLHGIDEVDYLKKNKLKTMYASLSILVIQGWGQRWFSRTSFPSKQRQYNWPEDSTQ
jgi:hypothetical protein